MRRTAAPRTNSGERCALCYVVIAEAVFTVVSLPALRTVKRHVRQNNQWLLNGTLDGGHVRGKEAQTLKTLKLQNLQFP